MPWTSRDVTNLHEIPCRAVVLGGGVVACEAANWLHGLGVAELTVIERGPSLLARMEPFAGEMVADRMRAAGVDVRLGAGATRVERTAPADTGEGLVHGGPVTVTLTDGAVIGADEVVVAAGRTPTSSCLGLETVGVTTNSRGFIAARAAGRPLDGDRYRDRADHGVIPQVTFTDPEVASVGYTEAAARGTGIDVATVEHDLGAVAGASLLRDGYTGRAKLVIDADRDVLVGATFVGPGVAELVHAATVAIVGSVPVSLLWHAVPSYPTLSEIWLRLLEDRRAASATAG